MTTNTSVRAAAEGMPAINRRRAMLGAGAAAALAVTSLPAEPATATEYPAGRVRQLARELALAMDDWCADLGGKWIARVQPASSSPYPVWFENVDSYMGKRELVSGELTATIDAHRRAWSALNAVGDHDKAGQREASKVEFAAALALFGYRCQSIAELHAKGDYLASHPWLNGCELYPEETDVLIRSMTSGGSV